MREITEQDVGKKVILTTGTVTLITAITERRIFLGTGQVALRSTNPTFYSPICTIKEIS